MATENDTIVSRKYIYIEGINCWTQNVDRIIETCEHWTQESEPTIEQAIEIFNEIRKVMNPFRNSTRNDRDTTINKVPTINEMLYRIEMILYGLIARQGCTGQHWFHVADDSYPVTTEPSSKSFKPLFTYIHGLELKHRY